MSALLAICALVWPMFLAAAVGAWCDRHPEVTDRIGESFTDHYWRDYYGE